MGVGGHKAAFDHFVTHPAPFSVLGLTGDVVPCVKGCADHYAKQDGVGGTAGCSDVPIIVNRQEDVNSTC